MAPLPTLSWLKDRGDDVISGTKAESTRPFLDRIRDFLAQKEILLVKDSLFLSWKLEKRRRGSRAGTRYDTTLPDARATLTGNCRLQGPDSAPTHDDR